MLRLWLAANEREELSAGVPHKDELRVAATQRHEQRLQSAHMPLDKGRCCRHATTTIPASARRRLLLHAESAEEEEERGSWLCRKRVTEAAAEAAAEAAEVEQAL